MKNEKNWGIVWNHSSLSKKPRDERARLSLGFFWGETNKMYKVIWPMITRIDRRSHTCIRWLDLHIVSDSLIKVLYSLLDKYIVFQRNREAGSTPRSIFQCFFENTHASKWSQIDLFLSFQIRFYCLKLIWMCLWVLYRSFSKRSIKTCKLKEKKIIPGENGVEKRHRLPPGGNFFSPST